MAGWSAAYDAVFAKYGFIVSNDLDEAVTIAAVLTTNPLPKGDRVAVLRCRAAPASGAPTASRCRALQVPELSPVDPVRNQQAACRPTARRATRSMSPRRVVHSGGLQKSIDLLDASDEVDAILVVLSLSSDTRMPFKQAELKPVLSAQNKPIVFYSYTLPSHFAPRRTCSLRRRSAVGTDACRRRPGADGCARQIQGWCRRRTPRRYRCAISPRT